MNFDIEEQGPISDWANELVGPVDRRVDCNYGCQEDFDDVLNLVVHLNDGHGLTFNEIANYLKRNGEDYEIPS